MTDGVINWSVQINTSCNLNDVLLLNPNLLNLTQTLDVKYLSKVLLR